MEPPKGDGSKELFHGRFTAHDGLRGFLQAKLHRLAVYGAGSLAIGATEIAIVGWQRTWLLTEQPVEMSIPPARIRNVMREGNSVGFSAGRIWPRRRSFRFSADNEERAVEIADLLSRTTAKSINLTLDELREFHRKLRARRSWLTPLLVAANVAVFAAMAVTARSIGPFDPQQLTAWGADFGPLALHGQWWRLASALFVHLNILHLALNMWVLWNIGRLTERLYGSIAFIPLYFGAGLVASVTSLLWNPMSVTVGASGAIFGLLASFLVFLLHHRDQVPAAVFRSHWIPTLLFVVYSLVNGMFQVGVDNAAHVGGLLAGLAIGRLIVGGSEFAGAWHSSLRRSAVAALVASAVVAGAFWYERGADSGLSATQAFLLNHDWYLTRVSGSMRVAQDIIAQQASGTVSSGALAQRFENEVLPFWKETESRLSTEARTVKDGQRPMTLMLRDYARLRLQWARAFARALEQNDQGAAQEVVALVPVIDQADARIQRIVLLDSVAHRPPALRDSWLMTAIRNIFATPKCVMSPGDPHPAAADDGTDAPAMRAAAECQAQQLFLSGDYRTLDDALRQSAASMGDLADGTSRFAGYVNGLDDLFEYGQLTVQEALNRTSDWRRAVPDSVEPGLIEAMIFRNWAYAARGRGYASSVSPLALEVFNYRIEMAAASLSEVGPRAQSDPLWYELSLSNARDQSRDLAFLRSLFDRGIMRFPKDLSLYSRMLSILMPRWFGSREMVDAFVRDKTATEQNDVDVTLYVRLYATYAELEGENFDLFSETGAYWPWMKMGYEEMRASFPKSDVVLNRYARFACLANDRTTYASLRPVVGRRFSSTAWSAQTSLASCDRKFATAQSR